MGDRNQGAGIGGHDLHAGVQLRRERIDDAGAQSGFIGVVELLGVQDKAAARLAFGARSIS